MSKEQAPKPPKEKKPRKWNQEASIYAALRSTFRRSPQMHAIWNDGKEEYFVLAKNGNQMRRVRFKCEECGVAGPKQRKKKKGIPLNPQGITVDHIVPVVDPVDGNLLPDGTRNWTKQIARLMVPREGLRRLCQACHDIKSAAENKARTPRKKRCAIA